MEIIQDSSTIIIENNRGFLFGDAVFETVKVVNNKILFLEDHYFRLMASMRIVRMEIPMNFTMEFFEEQILDLAKAQLIFQNLVELELLFIEMMADYYLPKTNTVDLLINVETLDNQFYSVTK